MDWIAERVGLLAPMDDKSRYSLRLLLVVVGVYAFNVLYELYITVRYMLSKMTVAQLRLIRKIVYVGDVPDFNVALFATFNPFSVIFGSQRYKVWIMLLCYLTIFIVSMIFWGGVNEKIQYCQNTRILATLFTIFTIMSSLYIIIMLYSIYRSRIKLKSAQISLALFNNSVLNSIFLNNTFLNDVINLNTLKTFNNFVDRQ